MLRSWQTCRLGGGREDSLPSSNCQPPAGQLCVQLCGHHHQPPSGFRGRGCPTSRPGPRAPQEGVMLGTGEPCRHLDRGPKGHWPRVMPSRGGLSGTVVSQCVLMEQDCTEELTRPNTGHVTQPLGASGSPDLRRRALPRAFDVSPVSRISSSDGRL